MVPLMDEVITEKEGKYIAGWLEFNYGFRKSFVVQRELPDIFSASVILT